MVRRLGKHRQEGPECRGREDRQSDPGDRIRFWLGAALAAASATPAIATGIPTSCNTLGRSPWTIDTTTGTTAPVDPMGATMLIGPRAAAV